MTHGAVITMLNDLGLPYAYDHFAEGEAPAPPFICFRYSGADNFGADNIVYHASNILNLELYTDFKTPELEQEVERLLTGYELYYTKSETRIPSEQLYEILYTLVV